MRLLIDKEFGTFVAYDATLPGAPAVGRGRTMMTALGDWLVNNQKTTGIIIDTSLKVAKTEQRRRRRELAKR